MTTEHEQESAQVAAWEAAAYVQLAIPGVPYSAIRVPLTTDAKEAAEWADRAIKMAGYVARRYREAFPREMGGGPEREEAPGGKRREAPDVSRETIGPRGQAAAYCPEHNMAPCQFSAPQYNPDGDRMYHPLLEQDWYRDNRDALVKNHSLWWRETVDHDGKSNAGQPMPAPQRGR